jgi:hypothetical protein
VLLLENRYGPLEWEVTSKYGGEGTFHSSLATRHLSLSSGRGTQVVRERSAKPLCVSSILTRASNSSAANPDSMGKRLAFRGEFAPSAENSRRQRWRGWRHCFVFLRPRCRGATCRADRSRHPVHRQREPMVPTTLMSQGWDEGSLHPLAQGRRHRGQCCHPRYPRDSRTVTQGMGGKREGTPHPARDGW